MFLRAGAAEAASPTTPAVDGAIAARIGARQVALADVDRRWRDRRPVEYLQAMQSVYEFRREALEGLLGDLLIAAAATDEGRSATEYERIQVAMRTQPVHERDIVAFYHEHGDQLGGRTLAVVRDAIRRVLEQRAVAAARDRLVAELRADASQVTIELEAPRQSIEVDPEDPAVGESDAPVTVVVFSDFQCPFCAHAVPSLERLGRHYGDLVRVVWKDFPLASIHPGAFQAAEASHCAGDQGQYWKYHARLFANQQAVARDHLVRHAAALDLDVRRFNECLDSAVHEERVESGLKEGRRAGVEATPTMFVNGRLLAGALPFEAIAEIVDEELARVGRPVRSRAR